MDFKKVFLNDVLINGQYVDMHIMHGHSGPRYTMIFEHGGQLYRTQFIEGRGLDSDAHWLSAPHSDVAPCEAVRAVTKTNVVYVPATDIEEPIPTPMNLDYHL